MEQQLHRYAVGVAGAGFVLVWLTLGLAAAILTVLGAAVAMQLRRVFGLARYPRRRPARIPRTDVRVRRLGDEGRDLPLVPDEPSLIMSKTGF